MIFRLISGFLNYLLNEIGLLCRISIKKSELLTIFTLKTII